MGKEENPERVAVSCSVIPGARFMLVGFGVVVIDAAGETMGRPSAIATMIRLDFSVSSDFMFHSRSALETRNAPHRDISGSIRKSNKASQVVY